MADHIRLLENFRGLLYAPFYLANALGAYATEGVVVETRAMADPARTIEGLVAGEGDVAWGGPMRVMHRRNADPACDVVCFCEVVGRDPFLLVGREPRPDFDLRELPRLRLGSVSEVPTPWLCLQDDLRGMGLDPAAVPRVAGRSMAENLAALARGELDVVECFEPLVEKAVASGAVHVWHAAARRGRTAYTTFYTRRPTLEARGEALLRMTRALHRVQPWLSAAQPAEAARLLAPYFPDTSIPTLTGAVGRYMKLGVWSTQPTVSREGFDRLKGALLSGGFIARDIAYDDAVDNRFADAIAPTC